MKKLWRNFIYLCANNFAAEQARLIAWIPFLFGCGIALYFALPFEPNFWLSLAVAELWLLLFYLLRRRGWHLFFLAGLLIICGFINIQLHTTYTLTQSEKISEQTATYLQGRIKDISFNPQNKIRLLLEDANNYERPLRGNFRITLTGKPNDFAIGERVEMAAVLFERRPMPLANGFLLDRKYFYENLSAIGYSISEVFKITEDTASPPKFNHNINKLRHNIAAQIDTILPPATAGIADALLLGEKSRTPQNIADNYRNSGLAHFLSVSGLHLGSIAGLIFFLVRFLLALFPHIALRFDIKKIAAGIAIIFSFAYLLISGMAIPAQRAFIMTTTVLLGIMCNRQAISLRMVCFAASIILLFNPQALISVSFQMSFAAVYALVAFYERYAGQLQKLKPHNSFTLTIFYYLAGIVICDLVASLATAPFSLYHFHRLAIYTSLGNLLAGPLIGLVLMPTILLCLAALPFGLLTYPLQLLGAGLSIMNEITAYVTALPHSVWLCNSFGLSSLLLTVTGGYWLCIWQQNWRKWGLIAVLCGILLAFIPQTQPDVIMSPQAKTIAVRDNQGKLRILPLKPIDKYTQNYWRENLVIEDYTAAENRIISRALKGLAKFPADLNMQCTAAKCRYRQQLEWSSDGTTKLNGQKIDVTHGANIYFTAPPSWHPLWSNHCRAWQNCE